MRKRKVNKLTRENVQNNNTTFNTNIEIKSINNHKLADAKKFNEKIVYCYILAEKSKPTFDKCIMEEYRQKNYFKINSYNFESIFVYLKKKKKLFACSFSLGPLILLIINAIDLRVDGLRSLWLYRRPIGHRAQDIG